MMDLLCVSRLVLSVDSHYLACSLLAGIPPYFMARPENRGSESETPTLRGYPYPSCAEEKNMQRGSLVVIKSISPGSIESVKMGRVGLTFSIKNN